MLGRGEVSGSDPLVSVVGPGTLVRAMECAAIHAAGIHGIRFQPNNCCPAVALVPRPGGGSRFHGIEDDGANSERQRNRHGHVEAQTRRALVRSSCRSITTKGQQDEARRWCLGRGPRGDRGDRGDAQASRRLLQRQDRREQGGAPFVHAQACSFLLGRGRL